MRGLSELVFSTSNRCNARCQDCPVIPSPDPPMRLKLEDMQRLMDEVHAWGSLRLVVFTGGESFLLGRDLCDAVAHAAAKGVITRIVTNAFWAKTKDRAVEWLRELKAAGLYELNISCDDYHQAFIPLDNVKNANEAASELGIPALLVHRRKPGGRITVEYLSKYFGVDLHVWQRGEKNPSNNVISTARNIPLAASGSRARARDQNVAQDAGEWVGPCSSVLRSIIVFPDLSVQICCGIAFTSIPELKVASLKDMSLLDALKRGNQDLIANWLALEGPSSILDFIRSKKPDIDLPESYIGRCHLCNELFTNLAVRQVLAEHAAERRDGLLMMRGALDWVAQDWAGKAAGSTVPAGVQSNCLETI